LVDILPSSFEDKKSYRDLHYEDIMQSLEDVIPADSKTAYSMRSLIEGIVDEGSFVEVHKDFAANMITGFAKLNTITIGIIANNPMINSGCIDRDSSDKAARMVRFCDAFSIPIFTLVDTPGYLPGIDEEHGGIIRHGAKLLFAYSEATTTKITFIVRKAYGGAYIAMGSKHLGADYVYASPKATLAVMGAEGAVSILHHKALADTPEEEKDVLKAKLVEEYTKKHMNPAIAEAEGYVGDVISVNDIRQRLFEDIKAFEYKATFVIPKKHGSIPL